MDEPLHWPRRRTILEIIGWSALHKTTKGLNQTDYNGWFCAQLTFKTSCFTKRSKNALNERISSLVDICLSANKDVRIQVWLEKRHNDTSNHKCSDSLHFWLLFQLYRPLRTLSGRREWPDGQCAGLPIEPSWPWARHLTLTLALSTKLYKWVLTNLILGVTFRWTSIPS